MAYHAKAGAVLLALGRPDWVSSADDGCTIEWVGEPLTEQQVADYANDVAPLPNGQTLTQWLAENGGDSLLTRRRRAIEMLNSPDPAMVALRALARVVQARMSALLTALGRTPITTTQLVSLWADEIANGNVDDGLPE